MNDEKDSEILIIERACCWGFFRIQFQGGQINFSGNRGGILIKNLRGKTIFRGGQDYFQGGQNAPLKGPKKNPAAFTSLRESTLQV